MSVGVQHKATTSTGTAGHSVGALGVALAALLLAIRLTGRSNARQPAVAGSAGRRPAERRDRGQSEHRQKTDRRPHPRGPDGREAERKQQQGRGRQADTPSDIPAKGWKDILWRTYQGMNDDRVLSVAAGVTFYVLLALFPAIAALVSLYGLFFDVSQVQSQVGSLSGVLPSGAQQIIGDQVTRIASQSNGSLGFAFAIGLLISLWSANSGMKAIFDALNVVNDEEEKRSFIWLNAQSLLFTVCAIVFMIVAMAVIAAVPALLSSTSFGPVADWVLAVLRWPAMLVVVGIVLAVLYRYGPSRDKAKWRWVTWGSALASLGWLVFSLLFSWYVANFGSYNKTYGSLGAAIGFMTWMWLSTTIILLGAELDAEMEHQTAKDTTEGSAEPMGRRGATMADTLGKAQD